MSFRRLLLGLAASLALGIAAPTLPVFPGAVAPAYAQVSAEFQDALEPYGHWQRHARWGEVWVPDELPVDWRPYEYGHWVYTDEWGWYWISDPEEEDWGWVVFHYGRWAHSRSLGWFWIPDDEWAPAWVDWRYGGDYIGWAPLPPDELIVEYDDSPAYWIFVSPRYLAAPRWRSYIVPRSRLGTAFRSTRIVNRTVAVSRGRAAVNPGLSPAFIAGVTRAALPTYRVSPRVLVGTQGVSGAVRVTPEQLRAGRGGGQRGRRPSTSHVNAVAVQPTTAVIKPAAATAPPAPLGKGERGRLGTHPPRAAQGGAAPQQQQQQAPPQTPPPHQPQRAAPPTPPPAVTPQHVPAQPNGPPPQAKPERPVAPQTPPPARQEHERPHAPPPPPPAARPAPPPPPAVAHPPPPPHPAPPPAARPAPPPHPAPPAVAKPVPPAAKPAAPPAAKPPEKKPEEVPK